jgi:hypothetical protein
VSNHRNIGVLSHHQPIGSRTGTFVPRDIADLLVQRMAAERISAKTIRMMHPCSVFLEAVRAVLPQTRYIPTRLPSREVENCFFVPPASDKRPRVATLRAAWDWSKELPPADMRTEGLRA